MPNIGQMGRNEGLTGLVDLPGASAKFNLTVKRWQTRLTGQTRPRRGRGGGVVASVRWLFSSGTIVADGKFDPDGCPNPNQWKGQTGTITVQVMAGKTVTYPVIVTEHGWKYTAKEDTLPWIVLTAQVTGPPTYSGWSDQPAATDPSKSNQEQWGEGTVKTYDANGLLSGATRTTDIWGNFADSDSGETQLLASIVAAAQPPIVISGQTLKLRTAAFTRDALDGGSVLETWGLTDSADDVLLPLNTRSDDPSKLESAAHAAAINATPANPSVPHTVLVSTASKKLNDGITLNEAEYGPRTKQQALEQDGTSARIDKALLDSTGQATQQFNTGATPADAVAPDASLKVVGTTIEEVTADQSKKITFFDVASSAEKKTFEEAKQQADPNALRSSTVDAQVYTGGAAPNAPTVAGQKLRFTNDRQLTSADTSNQFLRTWEFGELDTVEELIFGRAKVTTDPSVLASTAVKGAVFTTGSEPAAPTVSGLVLRDKEVMSLTSPDTSDLSVVFWQFGERTHADDETQQRTRNTTDPNDISSEFVQAALITTGASVPAPGSVSGKLKLVDSTDVPLTSASASNLSVRLTKWGKLDSLDREIFPKLNTTIDLDGTNGASSIEDSGIRVKAYLSTDVPPTAPDDPPTNNTKIVSQDDLTLTKAVNGNPGTFLRVFKYAATSKADTLKLGSPWPRHRYETSTDPSGLESTAMRAGLDGDVLPTTITDGNGLTLIITESFSHPLSLGLGTNRTLNVNVYGLKTKQQEMEFRESEVTVDPVHGNILRSASIVDNSDTLANLGAAVLASQTSNAAFLQAKLRQLTPGRALQTIETTLEDKSVHPQAPRVVLHPMRGKPVSGFTNSAAFGNTAALIHVNVSAIVVGGPGGALGGRVMSAYVWRAMGGFALYRRFATASITGKFFNSLVGKVNASAFVDRDPYTCMYQGYSLEYSYSISGQRPIGIYYHFRTDSEFFINDGDLPDSGSRVEVTDLDSPLSSSGFYAATLFDDTALLEWPDTDDFSVFLA